MGCNKIAGSRRPVMVLTVCIQHIGKFPPFLGCATFSTDCFIYLIESLFLTGVDDDGVTSSVVATAVVVSCCQR